LSLNSLLIGLRRRAAMQAEIIALRHPTNPQTETTRPQSWRSLPVGRAGANVARLVLRPNHGQARLVAGSRSNLRTEFCDQVAVMKINEVLRAPRSPWQRA